MTAPHAISAVQWRSPKKANIEDAIAHQADFRRSKRARPHSIPKGLRPPAQGWRVTPTLGTGFGNGHNANCVAARGQQRVGRNRVAVGDVCRSSPRVVASLQPWALGRNPVGILGTRGGRAGRRNRPVGWLRSSIPTAYSVAARMRTPRPPRYLELVPKPSVQLALSRAFVENFVESCGFWPFSTKWTDKVHDKGPGTPFAGQAPLIFGTAKEEL